LEVADGEGDRARPFEWAATTSGSGRLAESSRLSSFSLKIPG
jgi:hypothetical protein